jgi:Flp pilus assembly protein TadD
MKDTTKAAENLEILARGGNAKVEDLQRLGDIYLVGKDSALALSAYSRAISTGSFDIAKVLTQAENLSMQNALPEASSLIQQARAATKGKLAPADEARLLKLEARLAVNAGKAGDAVPILQRVVELNPMDGGALMLLGQHYMDAKDDLKATNYFERAAQIQISAGKLTDALPLLKRSNEIKARDSVAKLIADIERVVRKSGSK